MLMNSSQAHRGQATRPITKRPTGGAIVAAGQRVPGRASSSVAPQLSQSGPEACLRRLVTLPATRSLVIAAARSPTIRTVTHRVAHDRAGLGRDLRRPVKVRGLPVNVRDLLLRGARHPAAGELASAGLLFLPGRYVPLGSVETWAARRIVHFGPPS
jgi:hypothetical protein